MAITTGLCTSFLVDLLNGEVDFSSDTTDVFNIALFTSAATLNADTTSYDGQSGEVVAGGGYTQGGIAVTIDTNPTSTGNVAYLEFADATWSNTTITARGALIYKVTTGNPSVLTLDFGSDISTAAADFVVHLKDSINQIMRFNAGVV
jgi:hypothetical protein